MYAQYKEAAVEVDIAKLMQEEDMRLLLTAIQRLIFSSKPVSVVSGSPLLLRLLREEGSVQNSPLSLMSLWLGLIRLIWTLRILWSG